MAFREIVAPTLRELFVKQIIDMVFSGELEVGEKLPTERALAEKMNISRSMVHTGLEDLCRMGFVTIEPRAGAYVADYAKSGNFDTLGAIVEYTGGKFSEEMKISLVEARNAVEGGALIRLAMTHTGGDIAALRAMARRPRTRSRSRPATAPPGCCHCPTASAPRHSGRRRPVPCAAS